MGVGVRVGVRVAVGVAVGVGVGVAVGVGWSVAVGVLVGTGVSVGVGVAVGFGVAVGSADGVDEGSIAIGVAVGVGPHAAKNRRPIEIPASNADLIVMRSFVCRDSHAMCLQGSWLVIPGGKQTYHHATRVR
jgi:hypothetical protein